MKAVWYERNGPAGRFFMCGDLPDPVPGIGEVLVRVHASGVNPPTGRLGQARDPW